jgi:hypothetical protein
MAAHAFGGEPASCSDVRRLVSPEHESAEEKGKRWTRQAHFSFLLFRFTSAPCARA